MTAVAQPASTPPSPLVTISWGGDIHLGRGVAEGLTRPGHGDPFRRIHSYLADADLRVANLEGQLTTAPRTAAGYYLTGDPIHVHLLTAAGFDLVGVANNHATDNGRAGLTESLSVLGAAGIGTVGGGLRASAYGPALVQRNGLRIAVLAYNLVPGSLTATDRQPGVATFDVQTAEQAVRAARPRADLVFVMTHWGVEHEPVASPHQRQVARLLVNAGADAVIGHHPHVVQDVEWLPRPDRRPALVAYSLGNFVFDGLEPDSQRGALMWTRTDGDGVLAFRALPFKSDWLGVEPLISPTEQAALTARLMPGPAAISPQMSSDGQTWFVPPDIGAAELHHLAIPKWRTWSYDCAGMGPIAD